MRTYTDYIDRSGHTDRTGDIDPGNDMDQADPWDRMDRMDRDLPHQLQEKRDLTLGMTALLGIFFAVVLVCAIFFGFGYSTGRTLHVGKAPIMSFQPAPAPAAPARQSVPDSSPADNPSDVAGTPSTTPQPVSKPSAGAARPAASAPSYDDTAAQTPIPSPLAPARPLTTRASYVPSAPATAPAVSGSVMVQIAAVMHPQDAEALAQALRRNGYTAVVRSSAQDRFLHVQLGPFPTLDQAKAMRARLQADGYDPILKP